MNKVILIGNVGVTPEVRTLESGVKVASFSLATSENYTNKKGEKVELTEWHRLEVWNGLAKVAETIIKKGDRLCIEGKIKAEKWEDKDGNPKTTVKIRVERIELLGNRREQVEKEAEKAQAKSTTKKGTPSEVKKAETAFEASKNEKDDLPF
eukprot:gene34503-44588_t